MFSEISKLAQRQKRPHEETLAYRREWQRHRYHNDPEFREKLLLKQRERRETDPDHRERRRLLGDDITNIRAALEYLLSPPGVPEA